jgi:hydrogenase maturation factor
MIRGLLIGPQIGEDAAVIDAGDRYLVVTTDPLSSAYTDKFGSTHQPRVS